MSSCGVYGGASGALTVCCVDLSATGTVPGSGVKVILCVTSATQESRRDGPSQGSACNVPLFLSLIVNYERIWAALPLISGANHFESADFPR